MHVCGYMRNEAYSEGFGVFGLYVQCFGRVSRKDLHRIVPRFSGFVNNKGGQFDEMRPRHE